VKRCTSCHERKPEDRFELKHKPSGKSYRRNKCRDCYNEIAKKNYRSKDTQADRKRERYHSDPEYRRKLLSQQHKWKYGITAEEKEDILAAQGGACAACGAAESKGHGWATDHDHACCPGQDKSCGKCIRGVLCTNCNLALGHAEDSVERLLALAAYLQRTTSVAPAA
jgi:hypothetical protein